MGGMTMEDGHFIDDPLVVVDAKPDFSGIGLKNKPENPLKVTIQVSKEDINNPDFNLYNFLNKKFKEAWFKKNKALDFEQTQQTVNPSRHPHR